jgi:hypothetical protein
VGRNNRPTKKAGRAELAPASGSSTNNEEEHPKFCLRYLQQEYGVKRLSKDKQAAFAQSLTEKGSLPWRMLKGAPKGGQGSELITADSIRAPIPPKFANHDKFMAFRYAGKLPMVGVRLADVYHILWIERTFGEVYDHGS